MLKVPLPAGRLPPTRAESWQGFGCCFSRAEVGDSSKVWFSSFLGPMSGGSGLRLPCHGPRAGSGQTGQEQVLQWPSLADSKLSSCWCFHH